MRPSVSPVLAGVPAVQYRTQDSRSVLHADPQQGCTRRASDKRPAISRPKGLDRRLVRFTASL